MRRITREGERERKKDQYSTQLVPIQRNNIQYFGNRTGKRERERERERNEGERL